MMADISTGVILIMITVGLILLNKDNPYGKTVWTEYPFEDDKKEDETQNKKSSKDASSKGD